MAGSGGCAVGGLPLIYFQAPLGTPLSSHDSRRTARVIVDFATLDQQSLSGDGAHRGAPSELSRSGTRYGAATYRWWVRAEFDRFFFPKGP